MEELTASDFDTIAEIIELREYERIVDKMITENPYM